MVAKRKNCANVKNVLDVFSLRYLSIGKAKAKKLMMHISGNIINQFSNKVFSYSLITNHSGFINDIKSMNTRKSMKIK